MNQRKTYQILAARAVHENSYIVDSNISDVQIGAEIFLVGCDTWYNGVGSLIP